MRKLMSRGSLAGKKTYVAGALTLAGTLAGWLTGDMAGADAAQTAVTALLAMTMRHGIAADTSR